MSTLKVNAVRHNSATSDAITTHSDGTITAKLANRHGRNLMVNGDMTIAQRATSSTTSGISTVDRFRPHWSGVDENPTQAQVDVVSGTTPYTLGFRKAVKITNGNQTTSPGTSTYIIIQQKMEAQVIANSGWNYTSTSSFLTLSFWVKSSVAQNFYGLLKTIDGTQQGFPIETGSLSADTWTKVTYKIPGASGLQFDNNNDYGLDFRLSPYRGTSATGSVTLGQWGTFNSSLQYPDSTATWYTTNDSTFEMTGVQLEVGDTATSFDFLGFDEELLRCQRYYCKSYNYETTPGTDTMAGAKWTRNYSSSSRTANATPNDFPTVMRATPTMTFRSIHNGNTAKWNTGGSNPDGSNTEIDVNSVYDLGTRGFSSLHSGSVPAAEFFGGHYEADAELA